MHPMGYWVHEQVYEEMEIPGLQLYLKLNVAFYKNSKQQQKVNNEKKINI